LIPRLAVAWVMRATVIVAVRVHQFALPFVLLATVPFHGLGRLRLLELVIALMAGAASVIHIAYLSAQRAVELLAHQLLLDQASGLFQQLAAGLQVLAVVGINRQS